jgi:DNA-binding transcriptional ArsR family regulator
MSIARLTTGSRVTRQAISKHLRVLEGAGLVRSVQRGRESIWRLELRRLRAASGYLDLISQQWDDALERLRAFVEE